MNRSGCAPVKTTACTSGSLSTRSDQLLELVGELQAEQSVRAAVDPDDLNGSAVLDV